MCLLVDCDCPGKPGLDAGCCFVPLPPIKSKVVALLACKMDPPATPPLSSSTSDPGLFTSNDRMTIICGGDVKSLRSITACLSSVIRKRRVRLAWHAAKHRGTVFRQQAQRTANIALLQTLQGIISSKPKLVTMALTSAL